MSENQQQFEAATATHRVPTPSRSQFPHQLQQQPARSLCQNSVCSVLSTLRPSQFQRSRAPSRCQCVGGRGTPSLLHRPSDTRAFRTVVLPRLHPYFTTPPPPLTLLFVPLPQTHTHTRVSLAHSAPGSAVGAGLTQAQQATDMPPGRFAPRSPAPPPPQLPLLRRFFSPRHWRRQPPRWHAEPGWKKLTSWEGAAGSRLKDLLEED